MLYLTFTIDRIENGQAILKDKSDSTVIWPKNKLPAGAREGAVLNFAIAGDKEAEKDKKELAKEMLNQILKTNE